MYFLLTNLTYHILNDLRCRSLGGFRHWDSSFSYHDSTTNATHDGTHKPCIKREWKYIKREQYHEVRNYCLLVVYYINTCINSLNTWKKWIYMMYYISIPELFFTKVLVLMGEGVGFINDNKNGLPVLEVCTIGDWVHRRRSNLGEWSPHPGNHCVQTCHCAKLWPRAYGSPAHS